MKNALRKSALREIRSTVSRFLSIFGIVAVGVGFFAGVKAAAPDMRTTSDKYFDDNKLADLRLVSTYGFDENDLAALSGLEGAEVFPSYYTDVIAVCDGRPPAASRLYSLSPFLLGEADVITLTEGRMPEKPDECLMNCTKMKGGPAVGSRISITDNSGALPEDILNVFEYTIVGSVSSPVYIDKTSRGSTSVGNGSIESAYYIPEENFCVEYNTEVYLRFPELDVYNCYGDDYKNAMDAIEDKAQAVADVRKEERYADIMAEADEELSDAEKKLADAQKEADEKIADGEKELADGRGELADAKKKIEDGEREIAENEQKLTDARAELADAAEKIADGEREIAENEQKLADGRAELEKAAKEIADGEREIAENEQKLADGRAELEKAAKEIADGEREIAENEQKLADGRAGLEKGKQELAEKKKDYEEQMAAAKAEAEDGRARIEAGEKELADGRERYETGLKQYNEGLEQYEAGYAEYEASKKEFDAKKAEFEAGRSEFTENEAALEQAKQQLGEAAGQIEALKAAYGESSPLYTAAYAQYSEGLERYEQGIAALEAARPELEAAQVQIEEGEKQLAAAAGELEFNKRLLDAVKEQLDDGAKQIADGEKELAKGKAQLEAGEKQIAAGEEEAKKQFAEADKRIADSEKEIEDGERQIAEAKQKLADGKAEYEAGLAQLEDGERQIAEAKQKLSDGKAEYEKGLAELEDGERQLSDGKAELADAKQKYADGLAEVEDGERQIADAKNKLSDGKADYEEGLIKLADGEKELEEGKAEAAEKIADAKQKLADARREVEELDKPKWYIFTRDDNPGYSEYGENAQRISNIADVFPVFFIIVAMLVCLTTMSRMIEDQRVQIGTLKALGYSEADIMFKYMFYALSATLLGSIAGVVIGMHLFPYVIMTAYGMMYDLRAPILDIEPVTALISTGVFLAAIAATVFLTARSSLKEQSAQLMRPKAPKNGERIFLEHITPIWKRLGFSSKVTARNLFRYKRKMLMTVIGISGCTALLVTGFALYDSINDIIAKQFGELQHYQGILVYDADKYPDSPDEAAKILSETGESIKVYQKLMTVNAGGRNVDAYIAVPSEPEKFTDFLTLRDRQSGSLFSLSDGDIYVDEKTTLLLGGVKAGDKIDISPSDTEKYTVTLTAPFENYPNHYIYMTAPTYESIFGAKPEYNALYFRHGEGREGENALAERILSIDGILSINFNSETMDRFGGLLDPLNYVIWVIIGAAGMLAFIVMYNLTNINITERIREIATLKVLGFYDGEVDSYIFRENILLALLGTGAGLILGVYLARFIITTAEVDLVMFGRSIYAPSFILAAVVTMVFAVLVSLAMHSRLKNVNMTEALKSVE